MQICKRGNVPKMEFHSANDGHLVSIGQSAIDRFGRR